ncbi:mediator of RNA polymerase II transcription subunit 28-like [Lytechinus pictus]|uniref:mediator of RNA polymerase II transcription subunit 28-like n=1 Tax=Lytechinus pictus TaxID=7653 RepID=UPI00240D7986|nr:mediator of RNA polymerase II transcription subunit 28-like [Lytechinus pictus]
MATHVGQSTDRHLIDELEAAFKACLSSLIAQENVHVSDQMELKTSVDQSMQRFQELAKETENFFLQRQMLMATTKPESIIKEEIDELKTELNRKNALLQKQQTKVNNWLGILQSVECGGPPQQQPHAQQQQLHHGQIQQQLARGTMSIPSSNIPQPQSGGQQHHGVVGAASIAGGGGDATPISIAATPLSGPLAHLEQATSSIGGFDRR